MAWATIGTNKIDWSPNKNVNYKDSFFFNKADVEALLEQDNATGITLRHATLNGKLVVLMVGVMSKTKQGKSQLLDSKQNKVAIGCLPKQDANGGEVAFEELLD